MVARLCLPNRLRRRIVPLYVIIALLFATTNGEIVAKFTANWRVCYGASINSEDATLKGLEWAQCSTSLLGLKVISWAQGSPAGSQTIPMPTQRSTIVVPLDSDGNFRTTPLDLSFLEVFVLLFYLWFTEFKGSRSLGKFAMSIKVVDAKDPTRKGLPFAISLRRQLVKLLGFLSMAFYSAWYAFRSWGDDPFGSADFSAVEFRFALLMLGVSIVWPFVIVLPMIFGGNTLHDRFAGTAVRAPS